MERNDLTMGLYDVNVSCTLTHIMKIINNKYAIVDDTLIVFQLSSEVLDMIKTDYKGKFNGITIAHIPVETGVKQYYQDLSALIKYIIFYEQNDIVYDNLFIINANSEYYNAAVKAVNDNQRKITKNDYALFPVANKCCFNKDITQMHFVISSTSNVNQSYFAEEPSKAVTEIYKSMPLNVNCKTEEPYASDPYYYELDPTYESESSSSDGGETNFRYRKVDEHEVTTFNIKGHYAQPMGSFMAAIANGGGTLTIERTVPKDKYNVVNP